MDPGHHYVSYARNAGGHLLLVGDSSGVKDSETPGRDDNPPGYLSDIFPSKLGG